MNDPCSFTSCCQVLDAEEMAVRHESHQGNQRDFRWSDPPRIHLAVINLAWYDGREKRWTYVSASGFLTQDYCILERLRHISLWNTRCDLVRCWAVSKSPIFMIMISAFQKGFWELQLFGAGEQDECKGEKVQTCRIHTLSVELSEHADLTEGSRQD